MLKKREIMTFSEAKEYLYFVDDVLGEVIFSRQCCLDFHNALMDQKAHPNLFISWVFKNYHQNLIINLCKILERKNNQKDKCTLRYFVQYCKDNYKMLKNMVQTNNAISTDANIGKEIECLRRISALKLLDNIDFDKDLSEIEEMYKTIKTYRDKRLVHIYKITSDIDFPTIDKLHAFVDNIERLMRTYHCLFKEDVDYSCLKQRNKYGNFVLHLE